MSITQLIKEHQQIQNKLKEENGKKNKKIKK
jgi:hypothetical protein